MAPVVAGASEKDASVAAILLHGRAQTPQYMLEIAGRIGASDVAYVAPAAPGGSWYPSTFMAPYEDNRAELEASLARVDAEVGALMARGWPRERIALLGFSQGACLAAEYVWRHPGRWAGLGVLTGSLFALHRDPSISQSDLAGVPVIVTNGDKDPWVAVEHSHRTALQFVAAGAIVNELVRPGREHLVDDIEVLALRSLLSAAALAADL